MKRIYDIGDGKRNQWGTYAQAIDENFTELEEGKINNTDVVQETGESTTQVMSQAAVTKELTELENRTDNLMQKTSVSEDTSADTALDFSDEIGNVIMRIGNDGHIRTKGFDSKQQNETILDQNEKIANIKGEQDKFAEIKDTSADTALDITDELGNVALRIEKSGNIKTKLFDSNLTNYKIKKYNGYDEIIDIEPSRQNNASIESANICENITFAYNAYTSVLKFNISEYNNRESYIIIDPTNLNFGSSSHAIVITDVNDKVIFASTETYDRYFINLSLYNGAYYIYMPANGNEGIINISVIDKSVNNINREVFIHDNVYAETVNSPSKYNIGISQSIDVGGKFKYEKNPYRMVYRYDIRGYNHVELRYIAGDINIPVWVVTDFEENILKIGKYSKSTYHECIDLNGFEGKAAWLFCLYAEGIGDFKCTLFSKPLSITAGISLYDRMLFHTENPLEIIKETPGLTACFRTFAAVGDSFASGAMDDPGYNEDPDAINFYDYSWIQYLGRACGAKAAYNFSAGGETVVSWWNTKKDSCALHKDIQCYYIALGINDTVKEYEIGNFDTDVDLENYENNSETFIGMYCRIIQYIRSIKSDSYIFLITLPTYMDTSDTSSRAYQICEVIRLISTKFDRCYLIDQHKYAPYCYIGDFGKLYFLNTHMSVMGYMWMSWMIGTYTDWIMRNCPDEFKHLYAVTTDN